MAEEEVEGEEKEPSKLMGLLLPGGVGAVAGAIVSVVVVMVLGGGGEAPPVDPTAKPPTEQIAGDKDGDGTPEIGDTYDPYAKKKHTGEYHPFDPLVISIFDREKVHYLRIRITLELKDKLVLEEITKKSPQIKDSLIFVLSDYTVRELLDNQAKHLVKQTLLKTLGKLLGKGKIVDIYFTEFVVQ